MTYENIIFEQQAAVAIIRLKRPKALKALILELFAELKHALDEIDNDDAIGCTVLTGNDKAFAAGADIKRVKDMGYKEMYIDQVISKNWDAIVKRPEFWLHELGFYKSNANPKQDNTLILTKALKSPGQHNDLLSCYEFNQLSYLN